MRHVEPHALGGAKPDPLGTPDMLLLVSDELAVVDNVLGKLYLVVYADPRQPDAWRAARERLERLRARLASPLPEELVLAQPRDGDAPAPTCLLASREAAVPRRGAHARRSTSTPAIACRCRCRSARRASFDAPPLALYRALRGLNPSPYMFYFDFGDHHVVGASPEIMVRVAGDTRSRCGRSPARARAAPRPQEDARIAEELLADPKERAEHVMLIDLGRNDVGRVAAIGSVQVTEKMVIERYSHVMHIVSNVEGRCAPGRGRARRFQGELSRRAR